MDSISSPPARGAWIEILPYLLYALHAPVSPPARGAWIEIIDAVDQIRKLGVAPRTGGVD